MTWTEPKYEFRDGTCETSGNNGSNHCDISLTANAQSICVLLRLPFIESSNHVQFPTYPGAIYGQYNLWRGYKPCFETYTMRFSDILLFWTSFGCLLSSTKYLLKPPVSHIMQCFEINLWPAYILQIICLHPKQLEVQKSPSDVRSESRRAAVLMLVPGVSIDMMPNSIMLDFCGVFQALTHSAFAKSLLRLSGSGENCVADYAPLGFLAESVWRQLWGT